LTTTTNQSSVQALVQSAESSIKNEVDTISKLAQEASKYPYYKYNGMWSRQVQDTVRATPKSNITLIPKMQISNTDT